MFREPSMIYLNSNTIWILDSEAKQNNGFASSPRSAQAIGILWSLSSAVPSKQLPHRLGKRQGKETCPPSTKPPRHGGTPRADPSQAGLSRAPARGRRGEAGRGRVPAPLLPGDADSNSACPAAQTASSFPLWKVPALLSALREVADK